MKKTLLILLLLCATSLFAQKQKKELQTQQQDITVLKQSINNQQSVIAKQKRELTNLSLKVGNQKNQIDSLKTVTETNANNINKIAEDFGSKIQQSESTSKDGIAKLDKNVNQSRLYWIIATLLTLLLGGILYWLLGKRIQSSKIDVETQIKNTKKSLEEESVKLDNKLVEVLETQLKLKQETKETLSTIQHPTEIDHSLALKVADEIIRIQKNLQQMDPSTKGLKHLSASVKRIQDNFAANGYELVEMLGKEYNEGMKATVNFIQDENIEVGKKIITRIVKPQVNYHNEMIQVAQIDVSES